ncbi:unnamed protein product [Rotaria sp. Silwood2]|nr:unnamed protein product [Rotaria sp. Silwood2]
MAYIVRGADSPVEGVDPYKLVNPNQLTMTFRFQCSSQQIANETATKISDGEYEIQISFFFAGFKQVSTNLVSISSDQLRSVLSKTVADGGSTSAKKMIYMEKEDSISSMLINGLEDQFKASLDQETSKAPDDVQWSENGETVAGGHGEGNTLHKLYRPFGLVLDDDRTMLIADSYNDRIIQWKVGDNSGQVVAGGNDNGNRLEQLNRPVDMLIDKETDSLIICDWGNRRVVRWFRRRSRNQGGIIIDNIACRGLAMDDKRNLYVSDIEKHVVKRYQIGDMDGIVVAGGHGKGNDLIQLNFPTYIFVDREKAVYVSENENHRVTKWSKGAKEGIIVAGGYGNGNTLTQLSYPSAVFVDASGAVYVADDGNNRIMRWSKGARRGTIIVGGYGEGERPNQLKGVEGLFLDRFGNLYVVDRDNNRVQRFSIEKTQ